MEEALHDVPLFREFAGLNWDTAVPDETTILRFRRLLEEPKLAPQILTLVNELLGAKGLLLRAGTVVDATLRPNGRKAGPRRPKNRCAAGRVCKTARCGAISTFEVALTDYP